MLVGRSAVMQELRVRVARVAKTNFTVLIEGESGAGKELVARELHERSPRARGPFVAVNCAALVETLVEAELFGIEERTATGVRGRRGKFEQADQGTLFLDEVADLSPMAQAKLLRVLQDLSIERVGGQHTRQVDVACRGSDQPEPRRARPGRTLPAGSLLPPGRRRAARAAAARAPERHPAARRPLRDAASTHAIGSDLDSGRRSAGRVRLAGQRAAARPRHRARGRAGPWSFH